MQIYHGKDDQGNTYSTLYAHMISTPIVSAGQSVTKGQVIGYVGSTGYSTGNPPASGNEDQRRADQRRQLDPALVAEEEAIHETAEA